MIPKTRDELRKRILQDLGEPVVKVNIAKEQIDNAIDDAVDYWSQYHNESQDHTVMKIKLTQDMIDSNIVPIPESVFSVLSILSLRSQSGAGNWMSYEFEMTRDAIFDSMKMSGGGGLSSYVMMKQYITDMQDLMKSPLPFDYRYHKHELHLIGELDNYYSAGDDIVLEVMGFLYKSSYNIWGDEALRKLATSYAKKYWGMNLSKFSGVSLPGGVLLNGQEIFQTALSDIEKNEAYIQELQEPLGIILY